jgi:hypothetical protein
LEWFAQVYGEYEDKLRENDSLDFDDLLAWALKLFKENPELLVKIKHIFVDEFQVSCLCFAFLCRLERIRIRITDGYLLLW